MADTAIDGKNGERAPLLSVQDTGDDVAFERREYDEDTARLLESDETYWEWCFWPRGHEHTTRIRACRVAAWLLLMFVLAVAAFLVVTLLQLLPIQDTEFQLSVVEVDQLCTSRVRFNLTGTAHNPTQFEATMDDLSVRFITDAGEIGVAELQDFTLRAGSAPFDHQFFFDIESVDALADAISAVGNNELVMYEVEGRIKASTWAFALFPLDISVGFEQSGVIGNETTNFWDSDSDMYLDADLHYANVTSDAGNIGFGVIAGLQLLTDGSVVVDLPAMHLEFLGQHRQLFASLDTGAFVFGVNESVLTGEMDFWADSVDNLSALVGNATSDDADKAILHLRGADIDDDACVLDEVLKKVVIAFDLRNLRDDDDDSDDGAAGVIDEHTGAFDTITSDDSSSAITNDLWLHEVAIVSQDSNSICTTVTLGATEGSWVTAVHGDLPAVVADIVQSNGQRLLEVSVGAQPIEFVTGCIGCEKNATFSFNVCANIFNLTHSANLIYNFAFGITDEVGVVANGKAGASYLSSVASEINYEYTFTSTDDDSNASASTTGSDKVAVYFSSDVTDADASFVLEVETFELAKEKQTWNLLVGGGSAELAYEGGELAHATVANVNFYQYRNEKITSEVLLTENCKPALESLLTDLTHLHRHAEGLPIDFALRLDGGRSVNPWEFTIRVFEETETDDDSGDDDVGDTDETFAGAHMTYVSVDTAVDNQVAIAVSFAYDTATEFIGKFPSLAFVLGNGKGTNSQAKGALISLDSAVFSPGSTIDVAVSIGVFNETELTMFSQTLLQNYTETPLQLWGAACCSNDYLSDVLEAYVVDIALDSDGSDERNFTVPIDVVVTSDAQMASVAVLVNLDSVSIDMDVAVGPYSGALFYNTLNMVSYNISKTLINDTHRDPIYFSLNFDANSVSALEDANSDFHTDASFALSYVLRSKDNTFEVSTMLSWADIGDAISSVGADDSTTDSDFLQSITLQQVSGASGIVVSATSELAQNFQQLDVSIPQVDLELSVNGKETGYLELAIESAVDEGLISATMLAFSDDLDQLMGDVRDSLLYDEGTLLLALGNSGDDILAELVASVNVTFTISQEELLGGDGEPASGSLNMYSTSDSVDIMISASVPVCNGGIEFDVASGDIVVMIAYEAVDALSLVLAEIAVADGDESVELQASVTSGKQQGDGTQASLGSLIDDLVNGEAAPLSWCVYSNVDVSDALCFNMSVDSSDVYISSDDNEDSSSISVSTIAVAPVSPSVLSVDASFNATLWDAWQVSLPEISIGISSSGELGAVVSVTADSLGGDNALMQIDGELASVDLSVVLQSAFELLLGCSELVVGVAGYDDGSFLGGALASVSTEFTINAVDSSSDDGDSVSLEYGQMNLSSDASTMVLSYTLKQADVLAVLDAGFDTCVAIPRTTASLSTVDDDVTFVVLSVASTSVGCASNDSVVISLHSADSVYLTDYDNFVRNVTGKISSSIGVALSFGGGDMSTTTAITNATTTMAGELYLDAACLFNDTDDSNDSLLFGRGFGSFDTTSSADENITSTVIVNRIDLIGGAYEGAPVVLPCVVADFCNGVLDQSSSTPISVRIDLSLPGTLAGVELSVNTDIKLEMLYELSQIGTILITEVEQDEADLSRVTMIVTVEVTDEVMLSDAMSKWMFSEWRMLMRVRGLAQFNALSDLIYPFEIDMDSIDDDVKHSERDKYHGLADPSVCSRCGETELFLEETSTYGGIVFVRLNFTMDLGDTIIGLGNIHLDAYYNNGTSKQHIGNLTTSMDLTDGFNQLLLWMDVYYTDEEEHDAISTVLSLVSFYLETAFYFDGTIQSDHANGGVPFGFATNFVVPELDIQSQIVRDLEIDFGKSIFETVDEGLITLSCILTLYNSLGPQLPYYIDYIGFDIYMPNPGGATLGEYSYPPTLTSYEATVGYESDHLLLDSNGTAVTLFDVVVNGTEPAIRLVEQALTGKICIDALNGTFLMNVQSSNPNDTSALFTITFDFYYFVLLGYDSCYFPDYVLCVPETNIFFAGFDDWALNGDAQLADSGTLRLVDGSSQTSSAYHPQLVHLDDSWRVTFDVTVDRASRLVPNSHGFAFVVQSVSLDALGDTYEMGYGGIAPSLEVTFDVTEDSVAVYFDGAFGQYAGDPIEYTVLDFSLTDGEPHAVDIFYVAADQRVFVNVDGVNATYAVLEDHTYMHPNGTAYVGFTGATELVEASVITITNFAFGQVAVDMATTFVHDLGQVQGRVGQECYFTLDTMSACGESIGLGGRTFALDISNEDGDTLEVTKIIDEADGTYTVYFTAEAPGTYTVDASVTSSAGTTTSPVASIGSVVVVAD